jgi:hypothetical protein
LKSSTGGCCFQMAFYYADIAIAPDSLKGNAATKKKEDVCS